jgi:hypothetical protein
MNKTRPNVSQGELDKKKIWKNIVLLTVHFVDFVVYYCLQAGSDLPAL